MSRRPGRFLPRWLTVTEDIREELEFHLDRRVEDLVAQGVSPRAAREQAEREFGDLDAATRELQKIDRKGARAERRAAWWTDLGSDIRYAVRVMRRAPGFTLLLLTTIALAIGANGATFSVLRGALVRGLPYHEPERLVHIWETRGGDRDRSEASYPDFLDWRAQSAAFSAIEGYNWSDVAVSLKDGAEIRHGGRATPGLFAALGVAPILGRAFDPAEDVPDGANVVILSHGYWQSRFGGDPRSLDSVITLDGRPRQVIGVLPPGFHFSPIGSVDFWLTIGRTAEQRSERFNHWVNVVARLKPGVSMPEASANLNGVMSRLAAEYPETNQGRGAELVPLRDAMLGRVTPVLVAMFLAMGLVLAIACANVASLLLARALGREAEIRLRQALGASRWRLARQLLVESLVVAVLGGALGLIVGQVGVQLLVAALPRAVLNHLPYLSGIGLDPVVVGYTALLAILTGLAFGLGPMMHALGTDAGGPANRRAGVTASAPLLRLRDALIVTEVALTLVLLTGTALVARSLVSLLRLELGYQPDQVLAVRMTLPGARYDSDAVQDRFFENLLAQVRALPGVSSVGAVTNLPLNSGNTNTFRVEGQPEQPPGDRLEAVTRGVTAGYFATLGVPVVAGRALEATDDSTRRPAILINQSLARSLFPGGPAVGERLRFYAFPDSAWEVVGVVGDVRTGPLEAPPPATVYFSHLQAPVRRMSLVIRSSLEPVALASTVRRLVREADPGVPVYEVTTLRAEIQSASAVAARRVPLLLLGAFTGAALLVSMVGLYGVVSYSVTRRSREFGIRMALGAEPRRILRAVLRYGATLAVVGGAVGLVLSLALGRLVRAMLFGVGPTDLLAYACAATLLGTVALAASYIPARRATRLDPMQVLRAE